MPRAKAICSVDRCLQTIPCPEHARPAWAGSRRNLSRPSDWRRTRGYVIRRDGFRCVLCGAVGPLEVDHILSVARGGSWEPSNLQTLCKACHQAKTVGESRQT